MLKLYIAFMILTGMSKRRLRAILVEADQLIAGLSTATEEVFRSSWLMGHAAEYAALRITKLCKELDSDVRTQMVEVTWDHLDHLFELLDSEFESPTLDELWRFIKKDCPTLYAAAAAIMVAEIKVA